MIIKIEENKNVMMVSNITKPLPNFLSHIVNENQATTVFRPTVDGMR